MTRQTNRSLPVIPSRNVVIFPGSTVPLRVGRAKSKMAIERASKEQNQIILLAQRSEQVETDPKTDELYKIGTLCKIERVLGTSDHGYQVLLRGVARVEVTKFEDLADVLNAEIEEVPDRNDLDEQTSKALLETTKTLAQEILTLIPGDTRQVEHLVDAISELPLLANLCAENLQVPLPKKQSLLEKISLKERVLELLQLMQNQKEFLSLQGEIREKLSSKMGKQQRESILREQLRAIQDELGEGSETKDADYQKKIADAQMPEDVRKIAVAEAKKLESTNTNSPEHSVIRNYLDLLCAMPWSVSGEETLDIEAARKSLDADHYGLEQIKKRIIQHLAVMKLKKDGKGSILLLVGPPGVGKTSLGQSIAKATGRKFVRASLGGVRDDSDIRGHRRTYIGAMPGRIVQGIKRAGVNNPVLMLDEIDKLGRGFAGDPAAALLEVLDPEQNATFADHYLDVPFDLSKVFFIATANSLESIPGPLLDRMEVIEVAGYTSAEKLHIARNHLLPKQLLEHGMSAEQMTLSDEAILKIINSYTREAGVRELQRLITAVCRGTSEKVVAADAAELPIKVGASELDDILGQEKYIHEVAERLVPPGVVTGLAWTPRGGEILFVESSLMPGSGRLTLTGQLGDVMKESAQIALSLLRSNLPAIVPGFEYEKRDIHVHVPAGAIPKDGPSAGVTMLTALASLFSGIVVSPKLAMTGEITLRGAVTPVGGIKEKVLGAHRAGIERIILSKRNERDLKDVPDEIKSQIKFEFVETVPELLKAALGLEASPTPVEGNHTTSGVLRESPAGHTGVVS
jgi:ATP-dependent Lon protease